MQQSLFPEEPAARATPSRRDRSVIRRRELNGAQLDAVTAAPGPLLVIAGAGSGKTRTLVYRMAHLIEQGTAPENILLLTFTRKAAQEMLWRASLLLDDSCRRVTGGTFHAVANMLLRRYCSSLGYTPDFTILDRADAEGIINLLKSSLDLGGAGRRFPSKRIIINLISKSINRAQSLEDLLMEEYIHLEEFLQPILTLRSHYESFKREHELMDYDDLLLNWRWLLAEEESVRRELSDRFHHILVDEYQDTNPIQADIVRLLAGNRGNVMVVGDDSQSIYSFRGADFRNIMDFPGLFPGCRVLKLEENFRSTQAILGLTNAIIDQAAEKYTKALYTRLEGGEKPLLYRARDEAAEARYVIERIDALRREGHDLQEMAVLFRSGFHSYKLEMELATARIPFEKRGGLKLTESAHVKDILSYFRVLVNPRDNLSWNRILLLLDKVGPKTARKIVAVLRAADDPLTALAGYPAAPSRRRHLDGLVEILTAMREPAGQPAEQYELLLDYYRPLFENVYHDDYPRRSRDLEQLRTIISGYGDLRSFVDDTTLDPPELDPEATATGPADRLVLSTIHSAKGLEWDTVFIINLTDGKFPVTTGLPEPQWEEERRLLYVAATRARKRLFLSSPRRIMSADRHFSHAPLSSFLSGIEPGRYRQDGRAQGPDPRPSPAAGRRPAASRLGRTTVSDTAALQAGVRLVHPFFGEGTVESVTGNRTVEIYFPRHGLKKLHLDYARLTLAESN